MDEALRAFFERQAELFNRASLDGLADIYIHPLAVYSEGRVLLEQTREDTLAQIFDTRRRMLESGSDHAVLRVIDTTISDGDRHIARIAWDFCSASGQVLASSIVRYFCTRTATGDWKVEMVEIEQSPFAPRPLAAPTDDPH